MKGYFEEDVISSESVSPTLFQWALFHAIIAAMLAVDLGLVQRRAHVPSVRESALWSFVWILAASIFNVYVYFDLGSELSIEFTTAYVIEKSLSIENLFVFAVIFRYFGVELSYQHKVLFWGILGAIITRATFIVAGVTLVEAFHWVVYVFGGVLIYTGVRLAKHGGEPSDPRKNPVVKYAARLLPMTSSLQGDRFFVRENGRKATPLLLALLAVESTDIIFAVDSVPAVLAVTTDIFVAYTSNIFAILGMRALYFLLIQRLLKLQYLPAGLAVLLSYLGIKMLLSDFVKLPTAVSLVVVGLILVVAIGASVAKRGTKLPQVK